MDLFLLYKDNKIFIIKFLYNRKKLPPKILKFLKKNVSRETFSRYKNEKVL